MHAQAKLSAPTETVVFRTGYRAEMNRQIVRDSIHRRPGWTRTYLPQLNGVAAGYGTVATGGLWNDKPTVFEFYVLPEWRGRAFDFFDALLAATGVWRWTNRFDSGASARISFSN